MKKVFGLVLMVCMCVFCASNVSAADTGTYVAGKFLANIPQGQYLSMDGSNAGGSYRDDFGVGGAFAFGYDFLPKYNVPVRTELEYALRTDANFKYNDRNRVAKMPQTLLANMYLDFENETDFTPYVGGGVGISFVGPDTNFAWNVGGGVSYEVTENIEVDLGYRYLSLGQFEHRNTEGNLYMHEAMLALRYTF